MSLLYHIFSIFTSAGSGTIGFLSMFFVAFLLIGLVLVGALSPLLTFTALFQQKEWRLDRLREHLRRDGWFVQLFGRIRPSILPLFPLWVLYFEFFIPHGDNDWPGGFAFNVFMLGILGFFLLLAGLSAIQFALRKQRVPVWTSKAILITTLSAIISTTAIIFSFTDAGILSRFTFLQPFCVFFALLLQPLYVLIAWLLLKPLDAILKKRVMALATHLRSQMTDATVIGIAGSVGKTTVKELIAHLLQDLHTSVTPQHVNSEMGVAQWLLRQPSASYEDDELRERSKLEARSSKLLIIEMGAYRKGEIALLCRIAQPTIGVMTALGSDHLALFGSEQNIIDANGELIESLPKSGHAFFYGDNEGCTELAERSPCPVTIAKADAGYKHPLQGRHNDYNVSLAVAVAKHIGIKDGRIAELLETFKPQAHTFSVKTANGVTILDDTYNISPLSLGAALDWAAKQTERPRVLLTSGLQETGADENRYLTELGTKASKNVERVIFTDKHGAEIFAKAFGKPVEILSKDTARVEAGSLLLAVGRMPLSTVQRLLPTS